MVKGGSAWGKNCRREILHTLGRFLAILAIVALGVGFFCGLRLARPAMAKTGDDYLRKTNFYDYQLLSTVGFTDEDVAYFAAMDGVTQAEGSVSEDLLTTWKGEPLVFKTHELLQEINQVVLTAGRMPEKANEVLGDDYFFTEDDLGKTLRVDNEDESAFSQDSYVLVGLCNSPQYLNVQRGTSSLGNGTVSGFLFLTEAGYDTDYFTELYLTVDNDDDAFSEAYAAAMDAWETPLSDAVELRGQSRRDTLIEDAQAELRDGWEEYDDGLQEYEDSRADTDQELADAKQELTDALQELQDGEADYAEGVETLSALREDPLSNDELRDARKELDDGWQEYYDGLQEYEDGLATYEEEVAENQPKLDDAKKELQDALKQIREGEAEYNEGKATLQALAKDPTSNAELAAARKELDDGWAAYEAGEAEFEAQKTQAEAQLTTLQGQLQKAEAALAYLQQTGASDEQIAAAQAAVTQLQQGISQIEAGLAAGQAALDENRKKLEDGEAEFEQGYQSALGQGNAALVDARKELDDAWAEYEEGLAEYNDGVQQLADGKQELADAKQELDDARKELQDGEAEYQSGYEDALAEGEKELSDARKDLDDGWQEYYDGLQEYEDGVQEADEEFGDAKQELDDALKELLDGESDLAELESNALSTYALGRTANTGYAGFDNDTSIVEGLATIFPVFFFLVAALVCSCTMTRMVEEQRTEIGTLKALGYSDGKIMGRYAAYAGLAASLGCLIGYFLGSWLFPLVIWRAYQMLYHFGEIEYVSEPILGILSFLASLLCSAGVACLSAWSEMRKMPAQLMRPKAPKAGKRIFLEYITPLWRKMGFLRKVAARNVFRYKKRLIMMMLGVGGCLALLIAGLGLKDSIANVADDQYSTITLYDYTITFEDDLTPEAQDAFRAEFGGDLSHCAFASAETVDTLTNKGVSSTNVVATDDPEITALFGLSYQGKTVDWPTGTGAVVSEKLAKLCGAGIGDTIRVQRPDGMVVEIPVVGIFENYVHHYILLSAQGYETWMGEAPEYTTAFASAAGEDVPAVGAALSKADGVVSVTLSQEFQDLFSGTMESLNAVIALVVGCALALSFVVSYNLININITERAREIATIKVLGFYRWETYSYVFREALVLTGLGCVVGIPMGIWLHRFVMDRVQVDMVSFRVRISPWSYLLALLLTLLLTFVVDALLIRKIDRIHMAESLKSVE